MNRVFGRGVVGLIGRGQVHHEWHSTCKAVPSAIEGSGCTMTWSFSPRPVTISARSPVSMPTLTFTRRPVPDCRSRQATPPSSRDCPGPRLGSSRSPGRVVNECYSALTRCGTARPALAWVSSVAPSWYSASVLTFQVSNLPNPSILRAAKSAVIIEWSWLLYLCMPLRPASSRLARFFNQSRMTAT